jgi:multiple sugar transport system substrate-binding protein
VEYSGVKLLFGGLVIAAIVMTAFRPQSSSHPEASAANVTTISYSFWGSFEEWGLWKRVAESFEKNNPDVRIKINYIPDNYDDKIRLLLAADSAPDVMMIQDEPFPAYASYGKFEDLTDWTQSSDCPIDWNKGFWPTVPESFKYKGRVMGAPICGGGVLVVYNRKMFREMGVAEPKDDWTFDDFIKTAQQLTRDADGDGDMDTYGFTFPTWIYFLPWTWGVGADYLNADHTDWAFTGPEAVAAVRLYQDLRFKYHICPSIAEVPNTLQENAMFMTGRIGMTVGGPWNCLPFMAADVDFDVAHIPYGPTGKRNTRVTWDALCVFNKSAHKPEAIRFVKYCLSPEAQNLIGSCLRSLPTVMSAKDSFNIPNANWHYKRFMEVLSYGRIQPISTQWDAMSNMMLPEYELLMLNKTTPEECVQRMADAVRRDRLFPIKDKK